MAAEESQVQSNQVLTDLSDYQFQGNDYTIERKLAFIQGLIDTHTVYRAASIAGISKKTAYNWQSEDEQFAEAWSEALESSSDELESSMYERAKTSDTIAGIFLLKKYRPEFRDKINIDITVVQEEIRQRLAQVDQLQLPAPPMTSFIDTGYSNGGYVSQVPHVPQVPQISNQSDDQQKEE